VNLDLTQYPNIQTPDLLPRDVWVWTPPQYKNQPEARFPVIYMHDGQNLFYKEKSYTQVTWGVVETITKLSDFGFIRPAIVVGIDNTENRPGDYLPTKPIETPEGKAFIAALEKESPDVMVKFDYVADEYIKLIVETIKPQIDLDFRTLPNMENTYVIGSSMGGLISLYALVEYPDVFGGAGCLSTAWPTLGQFAAPYLRKRLPKAGKHRIYYDHGTRDLDAEYVPYQQEVDEIMRDKGYVHGKDWMTRVAPGAGHHERSWRIRMHIALRFFLSVLWR